MTARKSKPGIHAKCLATTADDGHTLICWRSPEHVNSTNPQRREHYDPSADQHWND